MNAGKFFRTRSVAAPPAGSCRAQGNSWTTGSVPQLVSGLTALLERTEFRQNVSAWCGFLLPRYLIWLQVSVVTD